MYLRKGKKETEVGDLCREKEAPRAFDTMLTFYEKGEPGQQRKGSSHIH